MGKLSVSAGKSQRKRLGGSGQRLSDTANKKKEEEEHHREVSEKEC